MYKKSHEGKREEERRNLNNQFTDRKRPAGVLYTRYTRTTIFSSFSLVSLFPSLTTSILPYTFLKRQKSNPVSQLERIDYLLFSLPFSYISHYHPRHVHQLILLLFSVVRGDSATRIFQSRMSKPLLLAVPVFILRRQSSFRWAFLFIFFTSRARGSLISGCVLAPCVRLCMLVCTPWATISRDRSTATFSRVLPFPSSASPSLSISYFLHLFPWFSSSSWRKGNVDKDFITRGMHTWKTRLTTSRRSERKKGFYFLRC